MKKTLIISLALVVLFGGFSVVNAQSQSTSGTGAGIDAFGSVGGNDDGGLLGGNDDGGSLGGNDDGGSVGGNDGIQNILKFKSFLGFFKAVVRGVIVPVGVVIAVLALIYSGFLFVVAQGKEEEIRKARRTFFYTVIGTILLLGAWAIVEAITGTVCQIANIPGLCNQ